MEIRECLPFWEQLEESQREALRQAAGVREVRRGTLLHGGGEECTGLLAVLEGRLRVYTSSSEGREITLYRLQAGEICLFSAGCVLHQMQLALQVEAEEDSRVAVLDSQVYQRLMEQSAAVANYTGRVMADRFGQVMRRMDRMLDRRIDVRLADYLLEELQMQGNSRLRFTHEQAARHMGSAREVVTRTLRDFQSRGWVEVSRGEVLIRDAQALEEVRES
ncbi:MAG: Crp/Fnr family transcriptional regulator [Eubacteriales bacterium]|jgi:CRP/FNR family transcriptional regulator